MLNAIFLFCLFILCSSVLRSFGRDTISVISMLKDGETLVSSGERFELGFFTLAGSSDNRMYVGIWYYKDPRTVIWVANRDSPLAETGGFFAIDQYGNLKVSDKSGKVYWSTDLERLSNPRFKHLEAKLLDSGNLVLRNQWEMNLWQSFEHPTDTFILGMKMNNKHNLILTSWTSEIDPKPGKFTFKLYQVEENQFIILRNSYIPHWRSGMSGEFFHSAEIPPAVDNLLFNKNVTPLSNYDNKRIVMNFSGNIQYWSLDMYKKEWSLMWQEPTDRCSVLDACGSFGSCNTNNKLACKCLPGFRPKVQENWDIREFSGGCTRNSTTCSKNDIFLELKNMKVGNTESKFEVNNDTECRKECLSDCRCLAYSYTGKENSKRRDGANSTPTCWIWIQDLNNLQEDYFYGGHNLFVRIASSDLESTARNCKACGTNVIPYPLSTALNCGDPAYFSFHCNNSTGKLSFEAPTGTYNVTGINPNARTFVIQAKEIDNCNARNGAIMQFNQSLLNLPFRLINATRWCDANVESSSYDFTFPDIDELEISWDPPPEPNCISSADCKDWPYSICNVKGDGMKRCLCNANSRWDGSALNCTPAEARSYHKQFGESSRKKVPLILILGVTIASVIVLSCTIAYICIVRRRMTKRQERRANIERNAARLYGSERHVKDLMNTEEFNEENKKGIDVPFFDLDSILAATDNFSDANKLGRGGFGPVYKGIFPGGQEIAIKRLSSVSRQGLEEFKNEVVLIARLQHRNLVRLLGYCIKGDEKILLYEYMPNKSLDAFIFDQKLGVLLNWEVRFNIILGVARGLLYLHQDSRLRIIHRDLKTSNILLDAEMNPKISDFGLARIFDGKQTEGSTNRVVGTYGYMSPEYALDGLFSVKSDVFSFGVVVLEILSGRKSTGVFKSEQDKNLLSYAWKLWRGEKVLDFMDETISECVNSNEFMKCLHIALLCVQEDPADRPTMSNVVVMLSSSETSAFPTPKQPAFVERKDISGIASSSSSKQEISINWSATSGGGR